MTVSVGNPSQEFRQDTVMPMEVFSLYADSIFPELAGTVFAPGQRCWVFTHPEVFLGHNTHRVSWNFRNCQVANSERCLT
jgi:hypothetical protein